jgi:signal transduction histidine kinase/sensor domain CHASE-containing protein
LLNKFTGYLASKVFVVLTIVLLASIGGIAFSIVKLDRDNHLAALRLEVEQALHSVADQIQLRFFEAVLVAKNIENTLAVAGEINERQIARTVSDLQRHNPDVIAVALAPNLSITHSFPQTDNRETIGVKYWQLPAQMASVAQAYRTRAPVVDDRVNLVQGGTGYIMHYPVFLPNAELNTDQFWGVISVVMDQEGLLQAPQHDFSDPEQYSFELHPLKASGLVEALPDHRLSTLKDKPVVTTFNVLGTTWEAAVRPAAGWPAYSPQSRNLVGFALISAIFLLGVLLAFRRLALNQTNAHALLAEAIDAIDEGFIAFDDKERVMVVNQKYRDYHPQIADLIVPGATMGELVVNWANRTESLSGSKSKQAWVRERLQRFRNPGQAFLQDIGNDNWLKVTEAKTPHGYTVGIWTDVTAEKRAQEAAEAADREKTEFLNNVSHELRTPLTVIFGRASFMRHSDKMPQAQRLMSALTADGSGCPKSAAAAIEYQKFITDQGAGIAESSQHMIRLVEDLLDWTKVSRGQLELDMAPTQLDEIARTVTQELQPAAEAKGLTLTYAGDGPAATVADKVRVKQILYNLITNAIKFTSEGKIHLSMLHSDDEIVFSVTDTGNGIAEEDASRVFQRFQQVDGSMTRQNGGLGLGLAISEQLAELHGGSLSLESKLGVGSTFSLTLPCTGATDIQKTA